jgi:hypothetical protein
MQAQIEKVRTEGETALNAALHHKAAMQESYEKVRSIAPLTLLMVLHSQFLSKLCFLILCLQILGELGYENEYLRKTCAEQEEQVSQRMHDEANYTLLQLVNAADVIFLSPWLCIDTDCKADQHADREQVSLRPLRGGKNGEFGPAGTLHYDPV